MFHYGIIGYFVLNPLPIQIQQKTISNIQNQFANLILDRDAELTSIAERMRASQTSSLAAGVQGEREFSSGTAGNQSGERTAPSEQDTQGDGSGGGQSGTSGGSRVSKQQAVEQSVAGQGILAVLTGPQGNAEGAVADVLGESGEANQNYKKVFENIDRLSSSGTSSRGTGQPGSGIGGTGGTGRAGEARGQRRTDGGSIDASVSALGEAQGTKPVRTTDIMVSDLSPLLQNGEEIDGSAFASGARDMSKVSSIVNAHSAAIQYCYERELKRKPDLKGKIAVRFTITPEGKVVKPTIISSTIKSESVERCVLSRISRWDDFGAIDPSLGNATFRQVYTFGF